MKAFKIHLNGQHLFTAGVGDDGILTSIVTWVFGGSRSNAGLTCHVGGVDGATDEHVNWTMPEIAIGDEVTVRVVETDHITSKDHRYTYDPTEIEAEFKRLRQIEVEFKRLRDRNDDPA